jgi:hypothetical protein
MEPEGSVTSLQGLDDNGLCPTPGESSPSP